MILTTYKKSFGKNTIMQKMVKQSIILWNNHCEETGCEYSVSFNIIIGTVNLQVAYDILGEIKFLLELGGLLVHGNWRRSKGYW